MDELGECIAETLQRQHDEQNAKEIEALESMYPDDFFTLMQGGWTRPEQDAAVQEDLARAHGGGRLGRRSTNHIKSGAGWTFPPQ